MSGCAPHDSDHRSMLKLSGLRVTAARLAILDALCHSDTAMDAQQVGDHLAKAGRGKQRIKADRVTVYRTLNSLVEAGIAHKVDPGDRVYRFSLAGDHDRHATGAPVKEGSPEHAHPHFVCDDCGTVECLDGAEVIVKQPEAKPAARRRITQRDVLLRGTCGKCTDEVKPGRRKAS